METTTKTKADASKIQVGDVFSRYSCGKVIEKNFDSITIKNTDGNSWTIANCIVEDEFHFASHEDGEPLAITRTEMIELVRSHARIAMTLTYHKKPDPTLIAPLLASGQGALTDRQWKKKVKEAIAGEVRVIQGVHYSQFDEHGRLRFTEINGGDGMSGHRLVDLRTLTNLTLLNQGYVLK